MKDGIEHHHFRFFLTLNLCLAGFLLSLVINQVFNGHLSRASASSGAFSTSNTPVELTYLTGPYFLSPNTCSPVVTIQAQDASGNPLTATINDSISLASDNVPVHFYSDSGCITRVQSVLIPNGSSEANFYIEASAIGWSSIGVSSADIDVSWQGEDFETPPTGNLPSLPPFPDSSKVVVNAPVSITINGSNATGTSVNVQASLVGYYGISIGGTVDIDWESYGATSCQGIQPSGIASPVGLDGSWNDTAILPNVTSETYTFICSGPGGVASSSVIITPGSSTPVSGSTSRPVVGISGTLASTPTQNLLTLTWSSTNATACTASGAWSGQQALSGTSVQNLDPATLETFTITCSGPGGITNASVTAQPPHSPVHCNVAPICNSGKSPSPVDFNNLFYIPTAYAQNTNSSAISVNGSAGMTPCSYIYDFASSCITPSNPSTNLTAFSGQTVNTTEAQFTITAVPPSEITATSSLLWSGAYFWQPTFLNGVNGGYWAPLTLSGTPYVAGACSSLGSQCWLKSSGSEWNGFSPADAFNGSVFILTYDAQWENGSWQGSTCVNGSGTCWRISVYPPIMIGSLIHDAENSANIQNIVSEAEKGGYIVQTASSDGVPSVVVEQPFTHETIISASGPEN
jgi:hypothetical protein